MYFFYIFLRNSSRLCLWGLQWHSIRIWKSVKFFISGLLSKSQTIKLKLFDNWIEVTISWKVSMISKIWPQVLILCHWILHTKIIIHVFLVISISHSLNQVPKPTWLPSPVSLHPMILHWCWSNKLPSSKNYILETRMQTVHLHI